MQAQASRTTATIADRMGRRLTGEPEFVEDPSASRGAGHQRLRGRVIGSFSLLAATPPPSDEALFDAVLRRRAEGARVDPPLAALLERWRRPASVVVRRVQATYGRGAPADEAEIVREAARKLVERGLEQHRGASEGVAGKRVLPRTFFLGIVKHAAIDRYRRELEGLEADSGDEARDRKDAQEIYEAAFKRLVEEHPNEAASWDLFHHEGVEDHQQCAKRLSISVVNSQKRVSRAKAYLRKYVLELGHQR